MLIGSRPNLDLLSNNFAVKVDNIPIERVAVYKSLGVSVDENLKDDISRLVGFKAFKSNYSV